MSTQVECVKVIQTESARLQQYLTALPQDAWTTPSACALWEVRDVVAHLTTGIEGFTLRITRGLQGDTSPPDGRSCTCVLRVIPAVQHPVQYPFYHLCEGAVPWYPISFSTSSG